MSLLASDRLRWLPPISGEADGLGGCSSVVSDRERASPSSRCRRSERDRDCARGIYCTLRPHVDVALKSPLAATDVKVRAAAPELVKSDGLSSGSQRPAPGRKGQLRLRTVRRAGALAMTVNTWQTELPPPGAGVKTHLYIARLSNGGGWKCAGELLTADDLLWQSATVPVRSPMWQESRFQWLECETACRVHPLAVALAQCPPRRVGPRCRVHTHSHWNRLSCHIGDRLERVALCPQ